MKRLATALFAYVVLGVLSWFTISDPRVRAVPIVILLLFAVKSVLRRHDVMHPDRPEEEGSEADGRKPTTDSGFEPM